MNPLFDYPNSVETIQGEISAIPQIVEAIQSLEPKEFYLLRGDLGAGKTTLSKELLNRWGISEAVMSPTFSLVNPYTLPNGTKLYHHDWYRLKDPAELFDAGIEEILNEYPSVHLIEWPDIGDFILRDLLQNFHAKMMEIQILHHGHQREYRIIQYKRE